MVVEEVLLELLVPTVNFDGPLKSPFTRAHTQTLI